MTQEEFKKILDDRWYSYKEEGNRIEVKSLGGINLPSLTTLPEGIVFSNGSNVHLESLTTLPERTVFSNGGHVHLESLTTLPERTVFSNGGHVYLRSLTTLPEVIVFSNSGSVYLKSLTTIRKGIVFSGGDVYLESLTGEWFCDWKGDIRGIDSKRLLNKMISLGLFNTK